MNESRIERGLNAASVQTLVTFRDGQMTIRGNGSPLASILDEIRRLTGARIDYAPALATEPTYGTFGPLPPQEAIGALLEGSPFNYVILSSSGDGKAIEEISVMPRITSGRGSESARPSQEVAVGTVPESLEAPVVDEDVRDRPTRPPIPAQSAATLQQEAQAMQAANPQMTRGEVLADLQRRQIEMLDQQAAAQASTQQSQ